MRHRPLILLDCGPAGGCGGRAPGCGCGGGVLGFGSGCGGGVLGFGSGGDSRGPEVG